MISWQESGRPSKDADFGKLVKLACQTPEQDRLFILPAYGDNKDFAGLYQSVRWDDFLVRDLDSGLALFRGILDAFGKAGFETVMLDSRTGITDIGGLLAVLLPHATVLVGNYGRQNTKGLAHVWQALQPAHEGRIAPRGALPPLTRILVASPIADELDLRAKGEEIWKKAFGLAPAELITIPFDQRLLFTEELYAATRPDTPVAKAYNDLERRIDMVRQQVIAETESARRSDDTRPDLVVRRNKEIHAQGKSFEERVAHLLRLLGYTVEREQCPQACRFRSRRGVSGRMQGSSKRHSERDRADIQNVARWPDCKRDADTWHGRFCTRLQSGCSQFCTRAGNTGAYLR